MPDASTPQRAAPTQSRRPRPVERPFYGLIDSIIVADPADFVFEGSISHTHAQAIWTWLARDVAPDLIDRSGADEDESRAQFELRLPDVLIRARGVYADAAYDPELTRRAIVQLNGEEVWARVPAMLMALKSRLLLEKAQEFGRVINAMADDAALVAALPSIPRTDPQIHAMFLHAMVGQVTAPHRLIVAAIKITNAATDAALQRAGFTPLIEAMLAHAQAQIPVVQQIGPFADVDLICRALDRFHKLMRAVGGYIELTRMGRWASISASLTTEISAQLAPRLQHVMPDINLSMRRREGADRVDSEQLLAALNGCFLLATVRECRDSLAVNTVFEQTWAQVGQALEVHVQRYLDLYRQHPQDRGIGARLEAAIKMAELRFNTEYADVLRRARESVERRVS
jgi:hypothetical protein